MLALPRNRPKRLPTQTEVKIVKVQQTIKYLTPILVILSNQFSTYR